jgi:hypothetical protein
VRIIARRSIAIVGGLIIPVAGLVWGNRASGFVIDLFHQVYDVASALGNDATYNTFGDAYTFLGTFALCLATGISFAAMLWDRRPGPNRYAVVYWVFLAALLPLAIVNYSQGDIYMKRSKQALMDMVLVFLGSVTVINSVQIRLQSIPARVLQAMAIFFIAFQAVLEPAIYGTLWWLNWQGAISRAQAKDWSPGWISAVAAIGSPIVSILNYRRSAPDRTITKPLILAP